MWYFSIHGFMGKMVVLRNRYKVLILVMRLVNGPRYSCDNQRGTLKWGWSSWCLLLRIFSVQQTVNFLLFWSPTTPYLFLLWSQHLSKNLCILTVYLWDERRQSLLAFCTVQVFSLGLSQWEGNLPTWPVLQCWYSIELHWGTVPQTEGAVIRWK